MVESFKTVDMPTKISKGEYNYFVELAGLAEKYTVELALPNEKKKEEKKEEKKPVSIKELIANKLVLPQVNMTNSGNFLNEEYISGFLKNDEQNGALVFDYTIQTKLFKRFTKEDPARATIISKFIDAIVLHPKANEINILNMANCLAADELLTTLCEKCLANKL